MINVTAPNTELTETGSGVRDLRCFDGELVSEKCDDELKEPEIATKNIEAIRTILLLADHSGRVLVVIREAMGSSKRQCTL